MKKLDFTSFFQSQQATAFWGLVFLSLLGYVIAQPYIIESKVIDSREKVVVLDQAGSFHVAKLKEPHQLKPLVDYMAHQCTKALLERDKEGLLHYELASQCFKAEVKKELMDRMRSENGIFKDGSIRRVRTISELKYYKKNRNLFDIGVFGEMVRTDIFEGQKIYTVTPFKLSLLLNRNPQAGDNEYMPLAVSKFVLELKEGRVE